MTRSYRSAIVGSLALAASPPLFAQVPPELFGGGEVAQEDLDKKRFYESTKGEWFQHAPRDESGLGCVISFISIDGEGDAATPGDTFGILGPSTSKAADQGMGLVVFTGSRVPRAAVDQSEVRVTILSDEPPNTAKVMHLNLGESSAFMVPVHVNQMIDASNPTESIGIEFEGKEVFRVNIVEYNKARTMLRDCMAKYKGKRAK